MDQLSFWTPVSYSKEEEPLTFGEQALQICDACFSIWTNQKGRVYSKQNGSLYQSAILEKQERSTFSTIIIVAAHFFLIPAAVAFIGKVILRHKYRFTIYEKNESITNAFNRTIALSNQKETALVSTNSAEEAISLRSSTTANQNSENILDESENRIQVSQNQKEADLIPINAEEVIFFRSSMIASQNIFDESENSSNDIPLCWKILANHVYSAQHKAITRARTVTENMQIKEYFQFKAFFGTDNTNLENIITLIRLKSDTLEERKYTIPKENINNTALIQNSIESCKEEAENENIVKMSRSTFSNNNDAIFDLFFNTLTCLPSQLESYFQYMNPSTLLLIYYGACFYENKDIQEKIKKRLVDYSKLSVLSIDESEILQKFWEKYTWNCIDNVGYILVPLLFKCIIEPLLNLNTTLKLVAIHHFDPDIKKVKKILGKTGKHIDVHGMIFTSKKIVEVFHQNGFQKISDFEPANFFHKFRNKYNFPFKKFPKIIRSDSNVSEYIYQVFKYNRFLAFLQDTVSINKENIALETADLILELSWPRFKPQILQYKSVRDKIIAQKNILQILKASPFLYENSDFCNELYEYYKNTPNLLINIVKEANTLHNHENTFIYLIKQDTNIINFANFSIRDNIIEKCKTNT